MPNKRPKIDRKAGAALLQVGDNWSPMKANVLLQSAEHGGEPRSTQGNRVFTTNYLHHVRGTRAWLTAVPKVEIDVKIRMLARSKDSRHYLQQ